LKINSIQDPFFSEFERKFIMEKFSDKKMESLTILINERLNVADAALGNEPSDLAIIGATIVDVNLGCLRKADIAIKGSRISYVGNIEHTIGPMTQRLDSREKIIVPGLIDAHMHFESSFVSPKSLAEAIVPLGVTALIAEPHDWGNVFGLKGMELLSDLSNHISVRLFLVAPSRVPLIPDNIITTRCALGPDEIQQMMSWPSVLGLGKSMPLHFLERKPIQIEKILRTLYHGKRVGTRFDFFSPKEIQAIAAAGAEDIYTVDSRHDPEDILNMLQAGLKVIVCDGSTVSHARSLAKLIQQSNIDTSNIMLGTYDCFSPDLHSKGYLDATIRILISEGVDPINAVKMATKNPAQYFGISNDMGSITPGRLADLVVLDDLGTFKTSKVIFNGKVVAENGTFIDQGIPNQPYSMPDWTRNTVSLPKDFSKEQLRYSVPNKSESIKVRVLELIPGNCTHDTTAGFTAEMMVSDGEVNSDSSRDILKLLAIDRYNVSGNIGKGFINGLGFKQGAIASTIDHDSYIMIAAGVEDDDIIFAVQHLEKIGGGVVVVNNKHVIAEMPLEIGGLITERSPKEITSDMRDIDNAAKSLGYGLNLPHGLAINLSFLTLPPVSRKTYSISDLGMLFRPKPYGYDFEVLSFYVESDNI
jgi:adenine deaminase